MSADFTFALYVFCQDYHSGQWSRLYRIMSRIVKRGIQLQDKHADAIRYGNNEEWSEAHEYYRQLEMKYSNG